MGLKYLTLRKKNPNLELLWSAFSGWFSIWAAFSICIMSYSGPITPYLSVFSPNEPKSGKNADQNSSAYGLFLCRMSLSTSDGKKYFLVGNAVFISVWMKMKTCNLFIDKNVDILNFLPKLKWNDLSSRLYSLSMRHICVPLLG